MDETFPQQLVNRSLYIAESFSATSTGNDCPGQPISVRRGTWVKMLSGVQYPMGKWWLKVAVPSEDKNKNLVIGWIPRTCGHLYWPQNSPLMITKYFQRQAYVIPDALKADTLCDGRNSLAVGTLGNVVELQAFGQVEWVRVECNKAIRGWLPRNCVAIDWPTDRECKVKVDCQYRVYCKGLGCKVGHVFDLEKGMEGVVGQVRVDTDGVLLAKVSVYGLRLMAWMPVHYLDIGPVRVVG